MSILPDYVALGSMKPSMFIDKLKKQVEEDNFIKAKINNKLNNLSGSIDYIYEFQNYKTNYWKTFLPRLEHIQIKWSPEKILNDANMKEINYKNWHRMVEVGNENCMFYSLNIVNDINRIIESSEHPFNTRGNMSYCCPTLHIADEQYKYIKYFTEHNSNINKNMKLLNDSSELVIKLFDIKRTSLPNILYEPLYKPSQTVLKFNLDVTSEEIKNIYLKFIDIGLNKGKLHIFDKYGRCILSNENKADILQKTYSQQDYKRIEDAITSTNQINFIQYLDDLQSGLQSALQNELYLEKLEIKTINNIFEQIPKLENMKFLEDYIKKITESYDNIFKIKQNGGTQSGAQSGTQSGGENKLSGFKNKKSTEQFNIHRHLSIINAQIEIEINSLVQKLTTTDKLIHKYVNILSDMGYFKKLYEEFKKNNDIENNNGNENENKSDLFRYTKKEETMQDYIKYMNDIINQLKNHKLSNPLNRDKIRPQYRNFLQFGENIKLFKMLSKSTREIYDFSKLIKSKHKYKVLFPEMVSSILHYLLVMSLVNLFDTIDNTKVKNGKTDIIDYKFIQPTEQDAALSDYANEMDINLVNEDTPLDDDGQPLDLIESFEFKNSNNLKVVGGFIIVYLDHINETQTTYDELTKEYINLKVTEAKQTEIENTLRTFEWLSMDTHEDAYQLVMMKMRLKKINYAGLNEFARQQYGDDFLDEENDEYQGEEDGDEEHDYDKDGDEDDERKVDKYDLDNELPQVFGTEDLDDGDMDYGYIGVGEDD
jgi:hypothetical protein